MNKNLFPWILTLFIVLFVPVTTFAVETIEKAQPANNVMVEIPGNPLGNLTESESNRLRMHDDEPDASLNHFLLTPHVHEITQITKQYHGEISRGVVAETTRRVNTKATLSYSKQRSVSNNFSVSIGFDKDVISSTLGYNVSKSSSETASYAVDVPANKLASITLYDMYDVSEFNVKTTYIYDSIPVTYTYEYGDGWAQQWTNFGFSSRIW